MSGTLPLLGSLPGVTTPAQAMAVAEVSAVRAEALETLLAVSSVSPAAPEPAADAVSLSPEGAFQLALEAPEQSMRQLGALVDEFAQIESLAVNPAPRLLGELAGEIGAAAETLGHDVAALAPFLREAEPSDPAARTRSGDGRPATSTPWPSQMAAAIARAPGLVAIAQRVLPGLRRPDPPAASDATAPPPETATAKGTPIIARFAEPGLPPLGTPETAAPTSDPVPLRPDPPAAPPPSAAAPATPAPAPAGPSRPNAASGPGAEDHLGTPPTEATGNSSPSPVERAEPRSEARPSSSPAMTADPHAPMTAPHTEAHRSPASATTGREALDAVPPAEKDGSAPFNPREEPVRRIRDAAAEMLEGAADGLLRMRQHLRPPVHEAASHSGAPRFAVPDDRPPPRAEPRSEAEHAWCAAQIAFANARIAEALRRAQEIEAAEEPERRIEALRRWASALADWACRSRALPIALVLVLLATAAWLARALDLGPLRIAVGAGLLCGLAAWRWRPTRWRALRIELRR